VVYPATAAGSQGDAGACMMRRSLLLPHNLLDLTELFLNFAGYLLIGTFSFQAWIIAQFPGHLLDLALHFMPRAFCLVPRA
jgi:hypothetical protein